ncbi:hypothetical protein COO60DRAFT_1492968 [Scenedesmus sp. NREL 46B-D3]|nr:hypothetical protein COO60DRAFT_1492968 [Scenedesmus sp. NREL 46B-D3]
MLAEIRSLPGCAEKLRSVLSMADSSIKEQPQWLAWLLCCLLAALDDALTPALKHMSQQLLHQQRVDCASSSSSGSGSDQAAAATAALQLWAQQQAAEVAAAALAHCLSGLHSLGQQLGMTLGRSTAAAAADGGGGGTLHDLQQASQAVRCHNVTVLVGLLQAACEDGSQQLAAAAGAVAAGMAAGVLEAAAAAGAAGVAAVEDVWAATVAAATPAAARHQVAGARHHNTARQPNRQQRPAQQQQQRRRLAPPQLEPNWVQQLQQQALLLSAAAETACERCVQQAVPVTQPGSLEGVAAASTAAECTCKLLLGHAYSRFMSGHGPALPQQQQQQRQQPAQNAAGTLCSLAYLLGQACSMAGLFHYAGGCGDAAAANMWLAAQQQQHPPHEVGMLLHWLASAVRQLQPRDIQQLLAALRRSAEQLAGSYSCYLQAVSGEVLQAVDAAAARQQLDRLFAVHAALLAAVWQQPAAVHVALGQQQRGAAEVAADPAAGPAGVSGDWHAAVAAEGLAALAALQFCQVQLPSYVELLRSLVTAVAGSGTAADAFLAAALPCYDALLRPLLGQAGTWLLQQQQQQQQGKAVAGNEREPQGSASSTALFSSSSSSSGGIAARAWMANPVVVARLSFIVPLIPLACKASADQAAAAAASLPLLLLLVPHPVAQLSSAAHSAVARLFSLAAAATSVAQRTEVSASTAAGKAEDTPNNQQQQQLLLQQTVERAVPLYLQRSLDALPGFGSMEGLAVGFNSIIRQLPAGSVMALLAVKLVADRAVQLAQGSGSSSSSSNQQQQQKTLAVDAVDKLFELVQLALQVVDYALLPSVLQLVASAVLAAPAATQPGWLSGLYGSCLAVDDYTRKPGLMSWIDDLARQVAVGQQQQQHWVAAKQGITSAP